MPQRLCVCYNYAVGRHSVFATVTIMLWDTTASLRLLQLCCGTPQCLCHRYNNAVGHRRRLCHCDNRSKPLGFVSLHTCTNSKNVIPCSCHKRRHLTAMYTLLLYMYAPNTNCHPALGGGISYSTLLIQQKPPCCGAAFVVLVSSQRTTAS